MKKVSKGSENVFEDLELLDSEEMLAKAELTRQIYNGIKSRRLTQAQAAKLLGLKQPDVSKLMRGRFTGFSTDRLIQLLNALGRDVEIVVKPKSRSRKKAGVKVLAA